MRETRGARRDLIRLRRPHHLAACVLLHKLFATQQQILARSPSAAV
jgi:hypothetical protein